MEHSSLQDLLYFLEYGTDLHITVAFLGNYGNDKTRLSQYFVNHAKPYCYHVKSMKGPMGCIACRDKAVKKAVGLKKPFGGLCFGGVFEYVSPVIYGDVVIAVIFIGNISDVDQAGFVFEKDFDMNKCRSLAHIIENHIKLLVKEYSGTIRSQSALIANIKNYIEENLYGEISVKEIAGIFNYNDKYIGKLFKDEEGMSLIEYVNGKRLDKSCELLKHTTESVTHIAQQTGFNNVTYFERLYKKRFGKSPLEFRKE